MPETEMGGEDVRFRETMWSTVLRARDASREEGRAALDRVARAYWKPVYFFVRRKGRSVEDAKDLAQGFFASLLERGALRNLVPGRGKFRSFLLTLLERFLINEREREGAQKRGGGRGRVAWDVGSAEIELARGAAESAEEAYERGWASGVLARAFEAMKGEAFYEVLRLRLGEGLEAKEVAVRLGMGAKEVDNALQRGKRALREQVMAEVRAEVGEGEAEEELRRLVAGMRIK